MPKTPKTHPKSKPHSKLKGKAQPEPERVSLTTKKAYWISVMLILVVFGAVYGYFMGLSTPRIVIMLAAVLSVTGFAFYIRVKPSTLNTFNRAGFIVLGISVIGFCVWALTVLSLNATGLQAQISVSIGDDFFAVTSLIICLMVGAFIGDIIGKNKNALRSSINKLISKIFGFKEGQ